MLSPGALARNATVLAALTGILLYATVHWGGVVREDRGVYLFALGVLAILAGLLRGSGAKLELVFRYFLPVLLAYTAFQMVPLRRKQPALKWTHR